MTDHLLQEPKPGHVKHTIATKALALMPILATWAQMGMYEVGPAKMRVSFEQRRPTHNPDTNDARRWSMQLSSGQSPRSPSTQYVLLFQAVRKLFH
jgi:hypothetical protein